MGVRSKLSAAQLPNGYALLLIPYYYCNPFVSTLHISCKYPIKQVAFLTEFGTHQAGL